MDNNENLSKLLESDDAGRKLITVSLKNEQYQWIKSHSSGISSVIQELITRQMEGDAISHGVPLMPMEIHDFIDNALKIVPFRIYGEGGFRRIGTDNELSYEFPVETEHSRLIVRLTVFQKTENESIYRVLYKCVTENADYIGMKPAMYGITVGDPILRKLNQHAALYEVEVSKYNDGFRTPINFMNKSTITENKRPLGIIPMREGMQNRLVDYLNKAAGEGYNNCHIEYLNTVVQFYISYSVENSEVSTPNKMKGVYIGLIGMDNIDACLLIAAMNPYKRNASTANLAQLRSVSVESELMSRLWAMMSAVGYNPNYTDYPNAFLSDDETMKETDKQHKIITQSNFKYRAVFKSPRDGSPWNNINLTYLIKDISFKGDKLIMKFIDTDRIMLYDRPKELGGILTIDIENTTSGLDIKSITRYNCWVITSPMPQHSKISFGADINAIESSTTTITAVILDYGPIDEIDYPPKALEDNMKADKNCVVNGRFYDSPIIHMHYRLAMDNLEYNPDTVCIGQQIWSKENLNIDDGLGGIAYIPKHPEYGRFYTWEAANRIVNKIHGWHLPTAQEWDMLAVIAGGFDVAGKKLKTKTGWEDIGNGTDEFGFSIIPTDDYGGKSDTMGFSANFWTATEDSINYAYIRHFETGDSMYSDYYYKNIQYSVRLIKDAD